MFVVSALLNRRRFIGGLAVTHDVRRLGDGRPIVRTDQWSHRAVRAALEARRRNVLRSEAGSSTDARRSLDGVRWTTGVASILDRRLYFDGENRLLDRTENTPHIR